MGSCTQTQSLKTLHQTETHCSSSWKVFPHQALELLPLLTQASTYNTNWYWKIIFQLEKKEPFPAWNFTKVNCFILTYKPDLKWGWSNSFWRLAPAAHIYINSVGFILSVPESFCFTSQNLEWLNMLAKSASMLLVATAFPYFQKKKKNTKTFLFTSYNFKQRNCSYFLVQFSLNVIFPCFC